MGCSTFGKKSATSPNASPRLPPANPRPLAQAEAPAALPPPPASASGGTLGGILARQVIDSHTGRPPAAYIQVAESGNASGAPIEVPSDSQGYFTIQGLQPGRQYL